MELVDFLFCDDIRTEISHKVSLIGVFNDRLVARTTPQAPFKWPLPIRLCTFLRVRFTDGESQPDSFTFEYLANEKSLGPMDGFLKHDPAQKVAVITILGQGIQLERGLMGFKLSLKKNGAVIREFVHPNALLVIEDIVQPPVPTAN